MEVICLSLLAGAADALWDPWLLGLFLLTGLLLSLGCGFFPLFRVRLWLSATLGSLLHPRSVRSGGSPPSRL